VVFVLIFAPVSEVYKIMFVIPHVALNSSMACRVFRGLKLGFIDDVEECSRSMQSSRPHITHHSNLSIMMPAHISELDMGVRRGSPRPSEVQWKAESSFHERGLGGDDVSGWV
jgi:hypothetical protein